MTQQGGYEYKLEVGAKSSEADKIFADQVDITMPKLDADSARISLARTVDSLTVQSGNWVAYYRRKLGEAGWGDALFYGQIKRRQVDSRANKITLEVPGILQVIKDRTIPSAAWGNTHVVDKEYAVALTQTASGALARLSLVLDAGLPAQVPLESCKLLRLQEYINQGNTTNTLQVFNTGAFVYRDIGTAFIARGGPLRKLWLRGFRTGAGATPLTVEIQSDSNGWPSGTVIASMTVASAAVPNGVGNEAWFEVDLLRGVANAQVLQLNQGWQYWVVLRMAAVDPTITYDFRCAGADPAPIARTLGANLNGAGWGPPAGGLKALFFALDFNQDWEECAYGAGHDYVVQGDLNPPKVFFFKNDVQAGDSGGLSNFAGKTVPVLYTGQKLVRATYWKGTISYAAVITSWADAVASDLYSTLDILITEPTNKQYCIQCENAGGLEAFKMLRQFVAITLRMYKNSAGNIVLEVRDEKTPDSVAWNLYTATEKARRTLSHGLDAGASSEVRIVDDTLVDEFVKQHDAIVIKDRAGSLVGVSGTGPIVGGQVAVTGGLGGSLSEGLSVVDDVFMAYNEIKRNGTVRLAGVDQSVADGPFRKVNEIIKLVDSKTGYNGYYALEAVTWSFRVGQPVEVTLAISDIVYAVFISSNSPGGPNRFADPRIPTSFNNLSTLKEYGMPSTGRLRAKAEGVFQGVNDAPTAYQLQSGPTRRAEDGILYNEDNVTYNGAKVWWMRVGVGVPAGPNLGSLVAEVMALAVPTAGGTVLIAHFFPADFSLASSWPLTITEVGVAWSNDEIKTGLTPAWAGSIGTPSGSATIFAEEPEMGPEKRIGAFIRIKSP